MKVLKHVSTERNSQNGTTYSKHRIKFRFEDDDNGKRVTHSCELEEGLTLREVYKELLALTTQLHNSD